MVEYPQKASQDTEVRTVGSTKIETIEGEQSQREKTLERSNKGKGVAKKTPSSLRGRPLVEWVPRWLCKEMIRNRKKQFNANEEDMIELFEVSRKLESPSKEARVLTFINSDHNQDFFSQVAIPPLDADVEDLTPHDYQIREVILGKPTLDTTKLMVTMGMKEVFRSLEWEGVELITLQRKI